jgi:hypothetical protein
VHGGITVTARDSAPPAGVYRLDPMHTFAQFSVKHLLVGRIDGRFNSIDGGFVVTDDPDRLFDRVGVQRTSRVPTLTSRANSSWRRASKAAPTSGFESTSKPSFSRGTGDEARPAVLRGAVGAVGASRRRAAMAELAFELVLAPSITCECRPQATKRDPHAWRQIYVMRLRAVASAARGPRRVGRLV